MAFDQSMTFSVVSCDKSGCKFFAKSRFALNRHTAKQHPEPEPKIEEKKLKCSKCDFKSNISNGGTLENNSHMRKHEDKCGKVNYEIQRCDEPSCEFKISSVFLLAKHERKEHGITTRLFPGNKKIKLKKKSAGSHGLLKCQKCGFSTIHKNSLRKHTEKCSQFDGKISSCEHCDFTSYSLNNVKRHSILNHGFFCKICVFTTKSKSEFLQHRKTHPITLKCSRFEECGFEGFKESVRKHQEDIHGIITSPIITKSGEKTCFRCGYSTTWPDSFR